ncbi:hypothetical protein NFI96_002157 [Prochilodus magdalenae]|nr:hypothetical protein NFI96_002157 [Prochilodus magdalenae]
MCNFAAFQIWEEHSITSRLSVEAPQAAHLFTQHREPPHTDKMLPALCTLFTALSCVSGVTVVTQKPPVLTATKGEKITMHCNLGTVTNFQAVWYKHVPGGATQYVLYNYHSYSSPSYGSGFSSPKFTSTHSSQSDYTLIISNVEAGDSAVYYCSTWDNSVQDVMYFIDLKLEMCNFAAFQIWEEHSITSRLLVEAHLCIPSSAHQRATTHTDKMLPALCTLFTALSCVSGVTVVTQRPPVLTATKGEKITMYCNLGSLTNVQAVWYKQVSGGVPQHVLTNRHDLSSPSYGSGFSSPKFTSRSSSQSDLTLIISNVEAGDSAVYYCKAWDSPEYVSQ